MPSDKLRHQWPGLVLEPYETHATEYKRSAPWDDLKYRIVKTALGMANLRDGGQIVIGVESDEADRLVATGMNVSHVETYRIDGILEFIDSFAQSRVRARAEIIGFEDKNFFVIEIEPFSSVPVIARKGTRLSDGTNIREGAIYCRPAGGKPRTVEASAEDLQEIIQHAVDLELRRYLERARRAGAALQAGDDPYERERGDL